MKNKILFRFFAVGIIITIFSAVLFFRESRIWYFFTAAGLWLGFDYIASFNNKNTALQIFLRDKRKFLHLYLIMILFGASLEYFGRYILGLWEYPYVGKIHEIVGAFFYPFLLFQLREMYVAIKHKFKNNFLSLITAVILGIIIWEIPNLFSRDWIYFIPFVNLKIFGINLAVILGWTVLILCPYYIYKIVLDKK